MTKKRSLLSKKSKKPIKKKVALPSTIKTPIGVAKKTSIEKIREQISINAQDLIKLRNEKRVIEKNFLLLEKQIKVIVTENKRLGAHLRNTQQKKR